MLTDLFNPATATSLGHYIATTNSAVGAKYACTTPANCTSVELVNLQWGSAGVTKNPVTLDPAYTPVAATTAKWGNWPVYGCEIPVEYSYYSMDLSTLNDQTVSRV